jgi:predicted nucleic acid-binding protein
VIVVADTSVLINLACVEQIDLLRSLFREVVIPPEVAGEFKRLAVNFPRFKGLILPAWIRQLSLQSYPALRAWTREKPLPFRSLWKFAPMQS